MLISQLKAIRLLKTATGLSIATCTTKIRAMRKTRDGLRDKIDTRILEVKIREINKLPEPAKPVYNEKQVNRILRKQQSL